MISRFLTFLLVPFYTNVLGPGEYGIVGTAYSYLGFLGIVFSHGMEAAYFRFAGMLEGRDAKTLFSTPFVSLVLVSVALSSIMVLCAGPLAALVDRHAVIEPTTMQQVVGLSAVILVCDTICMLPLAALRLQHHARRFAAIKLVNVILQVGLNVLFLPVLHWGVIGIFWGNAIAAAATVVLLVPTIAPLFAPFVSKSLWREMLGFGLPYLPAGISVMALQVIDRPILQSLTDDAHVGIYQANYRLGITMMVLVSMFEYAWRPFFLQQASAPDAKAVFARVLTYFTAVAAVLFLVISFFVDAVAAIHIGSRTIIDAKYWGGLSIVPIVLVAYVFNGWYTNMIAGVYIEKRMRELPWITGAGAAINVIANYALIPSLGIAGAAWATLISYGAMAGILFVRTRRFYPVPYEWGRIALIMLLSAAFFGLERLTRGSLSGGTLFATRCGLLAAFAGSFAVFRFFTADERAAFRRMIGGSPSHGSNGR